MAEQVAFDNWEDAFDDLEENKQEEAVVASEEKIEEPKPEEQQEGLSETKEAADPRKLLLNKLQTYKMINEDKFEQYFDNAKNQGTNKEIKASNQILKSEKDFTSFAKKVGKVFTDKIADQYLENINDEDIFTFFEETLLLIYNQFEWKSMEGVKDKLKIVKKEKKDEEKKALKDKEKQQRLKKQGKTENQKSQTKSQQNVPEDDIFGGATLVNSKQVEDEIKGKTAEKKVQEAPKVVEEDDDFM